MLQKTDYSVYKSILPVCASYAEDGKLAVNQPTGNFFYDPWEILPEFKETAIATAIEALPFPVGEARLVKLEPGKCYFSHADIDDRYHLNLTGTYSTLHDFENNISYPLTQDGIWYEMDAGKIHTAINAGEYPRVQLLVRKLLQRNSLEKPVTISVEPQGTNPRFVFDNTISPWLNRAVKQSKINNFHSNGKSITVDIDDKYLDEFLKICPKNFTVRFIWQL